MQLYQFLEEIRREKGVSVRQLAERARVPAEEMADYLAHGPYTSADIEGRAADALCLPPGPNAALRVAAYYRAALRVAAYYRAAARGEAPAPPHGA